MSFYLLQKICKMLKAPAGADDIKNPDSDIYLEKVEYDNITRKNQDIS